MADGDLVRHEKQHLSDAHQIRNPQKRKGRAGERDKYNYLGMKQHYIPRCYLRRFSDNDKSIFTYDKQQSKSYLASMMSVCFEDNMYSMTVRSQLQMTKKSGVRIC